MLLLLLVLWMLLLLLLSLLFWLVKMHKNINPPGETHGPNTHTHKQTHPCEHRTASQVNTGTLPRPAAKSDHKNNKQYLTTMVLHGTCFLFASAVAGVAALSRTCCTRRGKQGASHCFCPTPRAPFSGVHASPEVAVLFCNTPRANTRPPELLPEGA